MAQLYEANEIRVIVSEQMVPHGRIPKVVAVPWFHVAPEVAGKFRWAGTTTAVYTTSKKVRFATKYEVMVDAAAAAVSGHALGRTYHFSFTTPTIQLKAVDWYRKGGKVDGVVFIALRFNQPVDAETVGAHLTARYAPHEFTVPAVPALDRLSAAERAAFEAKVAKVQQAAVADGAVPLVVATDWDKKHWPTKPEQVVVQTTAIVPPESHLDMLLDGELAKSPSNVRTGKQQQYSIAVEPAFFVKSIGCVEKCNPDASNRIELVSREGVVFAGLRKAVSAISAP